LEQEMLHQFSMMDGLNVVHKFTSGSRVVHKQVSKIPVQAFACECDSELKLKTKIAAELIEYGGNSI